MASTVSAVPTTTIDPEEVARFSAIAAEWWDTKGKFAPLHRLNPVRLHYLRAQAEAHFTSNPSALGESATVFQNLSLLDIGCGGGLISEPMARLGAAVTGIDASPTNIEIAKLHAAQSLLTIDYRATTAEDLAASGAQYDVVLALEIIEHVADLPLFYDAITSLVKPGGLLNLSTLNRTLKSYALGIVGAERILRWLPAGTHTWRKFVKPSEMADALTARRFNVHDVTGVRFDPVRWQFTLDPRDLDVNYLMSAKKL